MRHKSFLLLLLLALAKISRCQEVNLELRSKGDPPQSLQQKIQQQLAALVTEKYDDLYSNYLYEGETDESESDYSYDYDAFKPSQAIPKSEEEVEDMSEDGPWQPTPFRSSPYATNFGEGDNFEALDEEQMLKLNATDEPMQDETGLMIMVDERTFNAIGNAISGNMGKMVKTAAKDLRGMVDGASKYVKNSLKKTFRPRKKPNNSDSSGLRDLFGLLPSKSSGGANNEPSQEYGAPNSNYGAPQSPSPSSNYGAPSAGYGPPQAHPIGPTSLNSGVSPQSPPSGNFASEAVRTPQGQIFSSLAPISNDIPSFLDAYGSPKAAPVGPVRTNSFGETTSSFSNFAPTPTIPPASHVDSYGVSLASPLDSSSHQQSNSFGDSLNHISPSVTTSFVPPPNVNSIIPLSNPVQNDVSNFQNTNTFHSFTTPAPTIRGAVTTVNPFLSSSKPIISSGQNNANTVNSVSTNFAQSPSPNLFSEPIYRPRRNQFKSTLRPGSPQESFIPAATPQPIVVSSPAPQFSTTANPFLNVQQPVQHPQVTTPSTFQFSTVDPQQHIATSPRPAQSSSIHDPSQFIQTTTQRPFASVRPQPTLSLIGSKKDRDFRDLKLAWYNYYRKAKSYEQTYNEKVNINDLRKSFPKKRNPPTKAPSRKRPTRGPTRSTTRPSAKKPTRPTRRPSSPTRPHPSPFSGLSQIQLPFGRPKNLPYFTFPSLTPKLNQPSNNQKQPALNLNRPYGNSRRDMYNLEESDLDTMQAPEPDPYFQGKLTPSSQPSLQGTFTDLEKVYIYEDDADQYDYNYVYDNDPVESQQMA